jgi:hypothetical protein
MRQALLYQPVSGGKEGPFWSESNLFALPLTTYFRVYLGMWNVPGDNSLVDYQEVIPT